MRIQITCAKDSKIFSKEDYVGMRQFLVGKAEICHGDILLLKNFLAILPHFVTSITISTDILITTLNDFTYGDIVKILPSSKSNLAGKIVLVMGYAGDGFVTIKPLGSTDPTTNIDEKDIELIFTTGTPEAVKVLNAHSALLETIQIAIDSASDA